MSGAKRVPGILGLLAAMAVGTACPGESGILCTASLRERYTSPDGRFMAAVYDRDCGPAGATTHLSIVPAGESVPNAPANTFVADRLTVLDVEWVSPEELRLGVPPAVRATRADTSVVGIRVRYQVRRPPPPPPPPPATAPSEEEG